MKLLQTLLSWHRPVRPVTVALAVASVDDEPAAAEEPPPGCGWFDSSHGI